MNDSIRLAIENLYQVFKIYKLEDPAKVSCFDYGPTTEEIAGISKDLRDIPSKVVDAMEFYGSEWGTDNEVKYFLPRLLECIAEDINRLDDPGYFSLFKYKLQGCFSTKNLELSEKDGVVVGIPAYTQEEKNCLQNFFDALLECHLSKSLEIGFLIECVLTLDMSPDRILANRKSNEKLHKNQIINLFKHFECSEYGISGQPKGVYLTTSEKIKEFLDLLYTNLTPEELAEINFK